MRKLYTKAKNAINNLHKRIEFVIVKGIALIYKTLLRFVLLLSMFVFFIIPFMNSWFG